MQELVQAFDETAKDQARKDFALLKSSFSGKFVLEEREGPDGKPESVLAYEEAALNGDFSGVDRFAEQSGGAGASIFARTGEDFIRVTTSVKKQDGERAYRTLLDRSHPAYPLMLEGKTYIGRAHLFGHEYMTVYEPIREGGRTIGILYIGSNIESIFDKLSTVMARQTLLQSGKVYAVDLAAGAPRGNLYGAESGARLDDKSVEGKDWMDRLDQVQNTAALRTQWSPRRSTQARQPLFAQVVQYKPWKWAIVAEVPEIEIMAGARAVLLWLWVGLLLSVILLAAVLVFATRRMVGRPVAQLSQALGQLAQDDLSSPVHLDSRDELGALAQAMESFRLRLVESLQTVRLSAHSIMNASGEIAQGNQDLSSRTETQASALEQTAASMEQLGSTTQHNAENAVQANQLALNARQVATEAGEVVVRVVGTMQGIRHSSQKIADIIGVIDGIAFQTNILALNAAVEAARAGEQGRGFAVVASEVRNLAQRTAAEAKTIKELIQSSTTMVQQGTTLADQAGASMEQVVSAIRRVADMVGEISAASAEQTGGVQEVGAAVVQLDQATQQNAALVEEMAAAAASLRTQAEQMVGAVGQFKLGAACDAPLALN